jgi:molybdenum cofactor synthesis domain-containing protein
MTSEKIVTAAMLAIGDELLSGRTKDKNIGHLADVLTLAGIDLKEVRIVADHEPAIVAALNGLRGEYDYVFTSGGIGPTHDDITADAVSRAFGVECIHDPEAMTLLGAMYERRGLEFTEARRRMARMPNGARHIPNAAGLPGHAGCTPAAPAKRYGRQIADRTLSLRRRRYRRTARRGAEGPSPHQHRILSEIRWHVVFEGPRHPRPRRGFARCSGGGCEGDDRYDRGVEEQGLSRYGVGGAAAMLNF